MTKLYGEIKTSNEISVNIVGTGARGLSAYEVWLKDGNNGTIEDFLQSLKGADGGAYIHPDFHSADIIEETEERQFISLEEKLRLSGYIHDQISSSQVWHVTHTLDKFPSVSVVDTGGNLVIGDVEYITTSELKISFNHEFSGKAYLN
jgi:hypothetical protein